MFCVFGVLCFWCFLCCFVGDFVFLFKRCWCKKAAGVKDASVRC